MCSSPMVVLRKRARSRELDRDRRHGDLGRAGRPRCSARPMRRCATKSSPNSGRRCRSTASCSACMARWSRRAMTIARAICWRGSAPSSGRTSSIAAELDPHSHLTPKAGRQRRYPGVVPRISAHRFLRARRACRRPGAARAARRDQAGDVDVRLPHDRRAADQPRADARLSSTASRRCTARTAFCRSR